MNFALRDGAHTYTRARAWRSSLRAPNAYFIRRFAEHVCNVMHVYVRESANTITFLPIHAVQRARARNWAAGDSRLNDAVHEDRLFGGPGVLFNSAFGQIFLGDVDDVRG